MASENFRPSTHLSVYRPFSPFEKHDQLVLWPTALAIAVVTVQFMFWQAIDSRHPDDVPLWLVLLALPILCGLLIFSVLWTGSAVIYVRSWRWRGLVSACVAPAIVIAASQPILRAYDPLHRLILSGALEARAAASDLPVGRRFASLDISSGLFVPPLTLLIYDETDDIGLLRRGLSAPIQMRGSEAARSIMLACSGLSEYVSRHFYVCRPGASTTFPVP